MGSAPEETGWNPRPGVSAFSRPSEEGELLTESTVQPVPSGVRLSVPVGGEPELGSGCVKLDLGL